MTPADPLVVPGAPGVPGAEDEWSFQDAESQKYHAAVAQMIAAARVLRDYDIDLEDREAVRGALRRAGVIR